VTRLDVDRMAWRGWTARRGKFARWLFCHSRGRTRESSGVGSVCAWGKERGIRLTARGARGEWCLAHAVHAKVQRRTQSISEGSGRDKKQGAWAVLCGRLLGWLPWARANEYGHLQFIQAILKGT
jgi:hypothetical protein